MKSISRIKQSSFPWHLFETDNCFRSSGFEIPWQPFTCAPMAVALCSSIPLMEMTSSVADGICITQITFKLMYNRLPANDGWFPLLNLKLLANFWTREYRLYNIADIVAKFFELFSDEVRRSLIFERKYDPNDVSLRHGVVLVNLIFLHKD